MPASFTYDLDKCNAFGCNYEQYELLLCQFHYGLFITGDEVYLLQARVTRRAKGAWSWRDKLAFLIAWIKHHAFLRRVPLSEHYPLESLFLYHFGHLIEAIHKYDDPDTSAHQLPQEIRELAHALNDNFDHSRNTLDRHLALLISDLDGTSSDLDDDELATGATIPTSLVPTPRQSGTITIALALLIIIVRFIEFSTEFRIRLPLEPTTLQALGILPIIFAWSYFGAAYIHSIPTLAREARAFRFYSTVEESQQFRRLFKWVRARLEEQVEAHGAFTGAGTAILLILFFQLDDLSFLEGLVTGVLWFVIWLGMMALQMIYPAWVDTGLLVRRMPRQNFNIDVYDLNGNLGLDGLVTSLSAAFWFNLAFLAIPLYIGAAESQLLSNPVLWLIVTGLTLLRWKVMAQIWDSISSVYAEAQTAVSSAYETLESLQFAERWTRSRHLESFQAHPLLSEATIRLGRHFVVLVVLPIFTILIQENWTALSKAISKLFILLQRM